MNTENVHEVAMKLFQGATYIIQMPTNWLIISPSDSQIGLMGPSIGALQAGFTITSVGESDGYLAVATAAKTDQAETRNSYELLEESDLSNDAFKGLMRYYRFFNPDANMVTYQRQIFFEINDALYILTSSQPANPLLLNFDKLFIKMMNSFRIGRLDV